MCKKSITSGGENAEIPHLRKKKQCLFLFFLMKFNLFLTLSVVAISFVACKKEQTVESTATNATVSETSMPTPNNKVLDAETVYSHNGEANVKGSEIAITETSSVVVGFDTKTYVFDNDAKLRIWASQNQKATNIATGLNKIAEERQMAQEKGLLNNPTATDAYVKAQLQERAPTGTLFQHLNSTGTAFWSASPSYGWLNNQATSFVVVGGQIVLCDYTWYSGTKIWIGAIGQAANLTSPAYNFNDRAESGIAL